MNVNKEGAVPKVSILEQPPKEVVVIHIRNTDEFEKILEIANTQIQSLQCTLEILKNFEFEMIRSVIEAPNRDKE